VLAMQRALREEGRIPDKAGLSTHVVGVTRAGGVPIRWMDIGRGLQLLRDGEEIEYFGLTGQLQFDGAGRSQSVSIRWWTIGRGGFSDTLKSSRCM
jgi:hypothetical protein